MAKGYLFEVIKHGAYFRIVDGGGMWPQFFETEEQATTFYWSGSYHFPYDNWGLAV